MTRYLDPAGISFSDGEIGSAYARACGVSFDEIGVPLTRLTSGDVVVTGPWGDWGWLPTHIDIEVVPDAVAVAREEPLVFALHARGVPVGLRHKPPGPRSRWYGGYNDAVRWVGEVAGLVSREATARVVVGDGGVAPHTIVDNPADARRLYAELHGKPYAFDLETTGLDVRKVDIVGVALADERMAYWITERAYQGAVPELLELLRDRLTPVRGSNLKYDLEVMACRHGLRPTEVSHAWDTQIMDYVYDGGAMQHGLKYLAKKRLGRDALELDTVIPKGEDFRAVPVELAAKYAAAGDARNSYDLVDKLTDMLVRDRLLEVYTRFEQPVTPVLAEMELCGLSLDRVKLFELCDHYWSKLEGIKRELREHGYSANINADAHVAGFLYEDLGMPVLLKTPRGDRGSVALPVLRRLSLLRETDPAVSAHIRVVELLMEWSETEKLFGTFLIKKLVDKADWAYFDLVQSRVVSGRLATKPNWQNIPEAVRGMVRAPHGGWIVSSDYSQGEPRLAAHYSQDPAMLATFREGRDPYVALGLDMGVPLEQLGKHSRMRFNLKTTFLAAGLYDTSAPKVQEIALRRGMFFPLAEASKMIKEMKAARPALEAWKTRTKERTRRDREVRDLFGRRRFIWNLDAVDPAVRDAAGRDAINFPEQAGLSGGILKGCMAEVQALFREAGGSLWNQIHDELLGWVPDMPLGELAEFEAEVKRAMLWYDGLSVPLEVETGHGRDWYSAKSD